MTRFVRIILGLCVALACSLAQAENQVRPTERVVHGVIVRKAPTTSSAPIESLLPGEMLQFSSDLPGWFEVQLPDGRKGYVSKAWTVVVQTEVGNFRIHAIDVGTGLALFVEGPDFTLLYDAGSNDDTRAQANNRVVAYLHKVRPDLTTIDHVILSHAHKDHLQLMPDVFDNYVVRNVWDSGRLYDSCGYRAFLIKVAAEPNVQYHTAIGSGSPHTFTFANCDSVPKSITVPLGPQLTVSTVPLGSGASMSFLYVDSFPYEDPNENSLVVRLDLGNRRILFMGDAEAGQRRLPSSPPDANSAEAKLLACCRSALAADVLVVGHHGSKTSSRSEFLDAVGAHSFIVSVGPYAYNGTVLPDAEVITELGNRGTVWRTDFDDASCRTNPAKIGPDADGKPGGCDNIQIDISAAGLSTSYQRISD